MTNWSTHLKLFAKENDCTYKQAMTDPKSKAAYAKVKAAAPPKEKKPRVKKDKTEKKEKQLTIEEYVAEVPVKKVVKRKKKAPTPTAPPTE